MNGIYIIAANNVCYHICRELLNLFISRIEVSFIAILQEPFRMDLCDVGKCNG